MGATTERRLTAFGETKTVAEWAEDARSRAWAEAILDRLDEGMTPEQAVALPVKGPEAGPIKILAFGERKTLRDWADDFRAEASLQNIRMRLQNGWTPESAISTPVNVKRTLLIEAFGETKSARQWEKDPRSAANRTAIIRRIDEGMDPEEAITTPTREISERGLTAFGETKTLEAWSKDPRCGVTEATLSARRKQGMSPEEAITRPSSFQPWGDDADRLPGLPSHTRVVAAFGERKSLSAWLRDPRCAVRSINAIRERIGAGMPAEEAITTPSSLQPVIVAAWGESKSVAEWAKDPRCVVPESCLYQRVKKGMEGEAALGTPIAEGWQDRPMEAFGETKTVAEWSEDERCRVSYVTLVSRLTNYGMGMELALIAPLKGCKRGRYAEVVEAFGEHKLLGEWMGDPRCAVSRKALGRRLRMGWELEKAMRTPERGDLPTNVQGKFVEAFGERKNLRQWSLDPRCAVSEGVFAGRLERGWQAERALSTPALEAGMVTVEREPRGAELRLTAWGETKRIGRWAKDPRCAVTTKTLAFRIGKGWPPEEAMAVPTGGRRGDAAAVAAAEARKAEPTVGTVLAWGERKTLLDWSDDPRSAVATGLMRSRIEAGWETERAISTPAAAPSLRLMEAWGETKSLKAWGEDPRALACMWTIRKRLEEGWGLEEALATPPKATNKDGVTAFGETKSLVAWSNDPRCAVGLGQLAIRLKRGMDPEAALTSPKGTASPVPRRVAKNAVLVTAWGETMTSAEWARDARCRVAVDTLRTRIAAGLTPEEAMTTPSMAKEAVTLTAFGETKTFVAWLKDPRCVVTSNGLRTRLAVEMTPEEAMTRPVPKRGATNLLAAFGESKTLQEWVADPRCAVTYTGLQKRVLNGEMTAEEAITRPVKPRDRHQFDGLATAFGETKPMSEWLDDPRRATSRGAMVLRIQRGWPLEDALTLPEGAIHPEKDKRRMLTAFGETKTLKDWGRDPRCVVAVNTVAYRVDRGWTVTDALTTPQLRAAVGRGSKRRDLSKPHVARRAAYR